MQAVHVSPFGGTWYPDCRNDLERLLDNLFCSSQQRTGPYLRENAFGFVVPHAGLSYSGTVAAAVYRHVRRQPPRRAVILGFAHRGGPAGVSIPDLCEYETPYGRTMADRETMERLAGRPPFQFVAEERVCDHSVEMQLPLLQYAAPHTRVVPLCVGYLDGRDRDAAAEALASLCAPGTLFLVSSDLTHFGRAFGYQPFAVDSSIPARLAHLDRQAMAAASSLDARYFLDFIEQERSTLCGRSSIALWLRTLACLGSQEIFQETLDYQTSGDLTGDYEHTVSYGALGYFPARSFALSDSDRDLLLESARETLRILRETGEHRPVPPREVTPALRCKPGVFVSLHQGCELLGCLGNCGNRESLAESVPELTLRAALDDPRFPTVLGVQGTINIEISILSPLRPVRDAQAFRLGVHGAVLERGGYQALLLPQVAGKRAWSASQFLRALSVKAGLGSLGYLMPGARLSVFCAQVFGQESG